MVDRSFVIYGDSRTLSSGGQGTQPTVISNSGFAGWAEAYSGNEVYLARSGNYAISNGNNSGWRAKFDTFVATPSRTAILYLGWNWTAYSDTTLTPAQTQARIGSMLDELGAAGKTVFLITETPQAISPNNPNHIALHEWLESPTGALLGRPFVVPVNAWDALEDPLRPNFPRPDVVYDGLHLTVKGNQILGEAIARAMDSYFADTDLLNLARTNTDLFSPANTDGVLINNPMLEGTGGTRIGAVSGDVATGWSLATNAAASGVTVVASKGISDAGFAEQVISFSGTPTGAGASITLSFRVPIANVQVGDALRGGAVIEFDPGGTGVMGISPSLLAQGTSGAVTRSRGLSASVWDLPSDGFNLPVGTAVYDITEVPRFVTFDVIIALRTGVSTQGVVRISQATVRDAAEIVDGPLPLPPPTNVPPDAEADRTVSLLEDAAPVALAIRAPTDANGNPLTITVTEAPTIGSVQIAGAGAAIAVNSVLTLAQLQQLTFTPAANASGTTSFAYRVSDGAGGTDTQRLTLAVTPVNDAPVASPAAAAGLATASSIPVTLNAADIDSVVQSFTITTLPAIGALFADAALTQRVAAGATLAATAGALPLFYVPIANQSGQQTFSFVASDGALPSNTAVATLTISPAANVAPDAEADRAISLLEDAAPVALAIQAPTDANNDPLTITVTEAPTIGSVQIAGAGAAIAVNSVLTLAQLQQLTFTPTANASGTTGFAYRVSDGAGGTDSQRLTLAVTPVNDAPVAAPAAAAGLSTASAIAVTLNAADIDSVVQSFTITTLPAIGALFADAALTQRVVAGATLAATAGALPLFYVPIANQSGQQTFSFVASDGALPSNAAVATLTITSPTSGPTHIGTEGNDNLTGSTRDDFMIGLGGNDMLNGGLGNDRMEGGLGNDTYNVDAPGDFVFDIGGLDTVISTIHYTLGADIENLRLSGTGAINGSGNASANRIDGNNSANWITTGGGNDVLSGNQGNDTLIGGEGDDQMTGGTGLDSFVFDGGDVSGTDTDRVYDYSLTDDHIVLRGFAAGTFVDTADGNVVDLLAGGTGVTLDSMADIVEVVLASPAVTASRFGTSDVLNINITDGDGDVQIIQLWNQWNNFVAAGGTAAPLSVVLQQQWLDVLMA